MIQIVRVSSEINNTHPAYASIYFIEQVYCYNCMVEFKSISASWNRTLNFICKINQFKIPGLCCSEWRDGTILRTRYENNTPNLYNKFAYRRHWISRRVGIVAKIQQNKKNWSNKKIYISCVMCCMLLVLCHLSHVTCHMSSVTCHLSHVTCH